MAIILPVSIASGDEAVYATLRPMFIARIAGTVNKLTLTTFDVLARCRDRSLFVRCCQSL